MASTNVLGVQDAYVLINSIAAQSLGGSLQATDLTSFITVGETLMQTGIESTLNAIGYVLGRTIFASRPYRAKLSTLERDPERYGMITRKITYLTGWAEETDNFNTQIDGSKLVDDASIDPFNIKKPKALQLSFPGAQSLQDHYTIFRDQLRLAFSSPEELIRFWEGISVEFFNMIETQKEAKSRAVLINRIAGQASMNIGVVDLVYEYNSTHNTSYSRADLLSTYYEQFSKFVAARIKIDSDRLTDRSVNTHASLTGYDPIVRHTPYARQKMVMYGPFFEGMKAEVYSSIFNPEYLNIGDFEAVNFWQSQEYPASINAKPNVLNTTTGEANVAGDYVELPYVLGILFDEDALGIMPKFESAGSVYNPRGEYSNLFWHWLFKMYNDYTENAIVYVLGDVGAAQLRGINSTGTLTPAFNASTYDYTVNVANSISTFTLYPTADEGVLITIYKDGTYTPIVTATPLAVGDTVFKIVTSKPGYSESTYTITVTRASEAKNGDDDEPAEEPEVKTTKSKK